MNQKFHTAYGSKKLKVRLSFEGVPTMTKQSHKDECDINSIMYRFSKTGVLDHINEHEQQIGDIDEHDFTSAMQLVAQANSTFAELPSQIRTRFDNDPAKFLKFMHNPKNTDEAIELGLASPFALSEEAAPSAATITEGDDQSPPPSEGT